jgi:leucyl aminopeptidase
MAQHEAPRLQTPKIRILPSPLSAKDLSTATHVAVLIAADRPPLKSLPFGDTLETRMSRANYKLGASQTFVTDLPNPRGTRLAIAGMKSNLGAYERLTLARKLIGTLMEQQPQRLVLAVAGLDAQASAGALEALLSAALAADFTLPDFKSTTEKRRALEEIAVYGNLPDAVRTQAIAGALGNNLARHYTALPPNDLTPGTYRRRVERLAKGRGWRSEFLDLKKLRRLGAGAFIAVAQGSPDDDAGLLHLRYTPRKKSKQQAVALVGKGICFDTGGTNLKSAKHMHGMHEDMQGSAVALGAFLALTELNVDYPVDCWLALAQNHIGPKAYRQNEVVRAASGTTIEIVHTDAEGRMILADALHLAAREKPRLIIDYATLTGACIGALGTRMSGALTNRAQWTNELIQAGEQSGERVWPFPLPDDYAELLKSDIADIKQCTLEGEADQMLAALFLKRFVPDDIAWVHLDLAAGNNKGGLAHIPSDITGFGVRFTLALLAKPAIR